MNLRMSCFYIGYFVGIILASSAGFAQERLSWGVKAGMSFVKQEWKGYAMEAEYYEGFNGAFFVEGFTSEHMSALAEIGVGKKGFEQWIQSSTGRKNFGNQFTYVSCFFGVKLHHNYSNMQPFAYIGPRLDYEIHQKIRFKTIDNESPRAFIIGYSGAVGIKIGRVLPLPLIIETRFNRDISNQYKKEDITNSVLEIRLGIEFQ